MEPLGVDTQTSVFIKFTRSLSEYGSTSFSPYSLFERAGKDVLEESMNRNEYLILANRYLLLQRKYLRLKEELEKFLKKKSGYKELRELLKKLDNCSSKTTKKRKEMNP